MSDKKNDANWWSSNKDSNEAPSITTDVHATSEPESEPAPDNAVTVSGDAPERGLITQYKGNALMLSVRPQFGSRRLIPYSRIEDVEINQDATRCVIYAAACVVNIEGQGFNELERALQRTSAWVVAVGKSDSNGVDIKRITITDAVPQEESLNATNQG